MKNTKSLFLFLIALFPFISIGAQTPTQVYDERLDDVLKRCENEYGVVIKYNNQKIDPQTIVKSAIWKCSLKGVEETLDNILKPLNLAYKKGANNNYELISYEYFRRHFSEGETHLQKLKELYPTRLEWEERRSVVKENLLAKMGLSPMPQKKPLNAKVTNKRVYDGYTVENVSLEVLPGVYTCGSLYKPSKIGKKQYAAMLCPHGHFYDKVDKSIPNERGRYRPDQQYRCAMLARMGVVVFSYDMFAWGESTLQVPLKEHRTGLALTMQTWNGVRIVDYLCSLSYIDQSKIGITGASGGGTQTFLLAAVDDRIAISMPTVMVSSHFYGGCPCESGLPIHFVDGAMQTNNAEIAALCAPRPQLIISDGNDWTSSTPDLEYPYLKSIYALYGQTEKVANAHFEKEGHDYGSSKRFAMYDFVGKHFDVDSESLKDKEGNYDESPVTIEPAENMYAFGKDRILPSNVVIGSDAVKEVLEEAKNKTK